MSEVFTQRVAEQIRMARASRQMSQEELAEKAGMSQPTLSRSLNGERPLDTDELVRVTDELGVSLLGVLAAALGVSIEQPLPTRTAA